MPTMYQGYTRYPQYMIDSCAHCATHFDSLEKAAKIAYRVIDIAILFIKEISYVFVALSSQIKDLVLIIESTRLFPVSFPLFFPDEHGKRFYQVKTKIQTTEKVSLTGHLFFKTMIGLDRVELIPFGLIATYPISHIPLVRWVAEGLILSYNFFGAVDGALAFHTATKKLTRCQHKLDKWQHAPQKKKKWEAVKNILHIDQTKAWLKVAATASKFFLIVIAVTLAAMNQVVFAGQLTILSLGIISDMFGLARIFYHEYCTTPS